MYYNMQAQYKFHENFTIITAKVLSISCTRVRTHFCEAEIGVYLNAHEVYHYFRYRLADANSIIACCVNHVSKFQSRDMVLILYLICYTHASRCLASPNFFFSQLTLARYSQNTEILYIIDRLRTAIYSSAISSISIFAQCHTILIARSKMRVLLCAVVVSRDHSCDFSLLTWKIFLYTAIYYRYQIIFAEKIIKSDFREIVNSQR